MSDLNGTETVDLVGGRQANRTVVAHYARIATMGALAAATAVALLWTVFPFYWGALSSFKSSRDTYGHSWLPFLSFSPSLRAWTDFFGIAGFDRALANSCVVAISAATISVLLGAPAAYGLTRFRYPQRMQAGMVAWFVVQRMLPPSVFIAPYILMMRDLGLIDTTIALILINATFNLPLAVIILSGAFRDVSESLEEAAWVDGAGRFGSFARIGLPLVLPAVVASWLLSLAFSWNEWMFGMLLSYTDARTVAVLIYATGGGGGANIQMASTRAIAAMAVPLLCALLAQRYIIRGLSLGAVKG